MKQWLLVKKNWQAWRKILDLHQGLFHTCKWFHDLVLRSGAGTWRVDRSCHDQATSWRESNSMHHISSHRPLGCEIRIGHATNTIFRANGEHESGGPDRSESLKVSHGLRQCLDIVSISSCQFFAWKSRLETWERKAVFPPMLCLLVGFCTTFEPPSHETHSMKTIPLKE